MTETNIPFIAAGGQTREALSSQNGAQATPAALKGRHIALVGFASTSCFLANEEPPEVEIWGCNQGYTFLHRATRFFNIHDPGAWRGSGASDRSKLRDPGMLGWYRAQPKEFPIYMLEAHDDIPGSVEFPIRRVMEFFRQDEPYLTSSIAYMLALAVVELGQANPQEPRSIRLFGIDMAAASEYAEQRACLEYYIGYAEALGIPVYIPENSPILKDRLYGGPREFGEPQINQRRNDLIREREKLSAQLNYIIGQIAETDYWLQAFGVARIMNPVVVRELNNPTAYESKSLRKAMSPTGSGNSGQPVIEMDILDPAGA